MSGGLKMTLGRVPLPLSGLPRNLGKYYVGGLVLELGAHCQSATRTYERLNETAAVET